MQTATAIQIVTAGELGLLAPWASIPPSWPGSVSGSTQQCTAVTLSPTLHGQARRASRLQATTLAQWRAYLAGPDSTLSPNTINRMLSAVKRLIKEAAAQGYCRRETAAQFQAGVPVSQSKRSRTAKSRAPARASAPRICARSARRQTLAPCQARCTGATGHPGHSGCRITEVVTSPRPN